MPNEIERIKSLMKKKRPPPSAFSGKDFVSTGSAVLNLGCSGRATGGLAKGLMYLFAGDSSSGKTWLGLSVLAEASINPEFDDYDLLVDPTENGINVNIERYFGKKLNRRIKQLVGEKGEAGSNVLEEFYDAYEERLKSGKPSILLLDSMDGLKSAVDITREEEEAKARKKGKEISGSYRVDKPKVNSARLRTVNYLLKKTGSILIMVAQTRHTIGFGAKFNPKTFSGGDALKFYPRIILWTSINKRIPKDVRGTNRTVGQITQVKIAKNHLSGWEGKLEIPFLKGTGIDDLGSCVDFLVINKHWKQVKGVVSATEFNIQRKKDQLVRHIEAAELQSTLYKIVARVWHEIEEESIIKRKSRYD